MPNIRINDVGTLIYFYTKNTVLKNTMDVPWRSRICCVWPISPTMVASYYELGQSYHDVSFLSTK